MKHLITITLLVVTLAASGCGQRGLKGLVKVSGTITLNGQPFEGASILFLPQTPDTRSASALSDAGGNFQITTLQSNDGVQPGDYLISVSKVRLEGGTPYEELLALGRAGRENEIKKPTRIESVPEKYLKAETSGLKITVKPGRNDKLVLTLEGEPAGKR
ncbi:MAG: carboxypeptidase-like regulatory domain-containing protein [Planctomycetaceae bacterium]|nr:carboxypeptidase-like regulatory domain-containing protein [Planctomycetaceae bacterium]